MISMQVKDSEDYREACLLTGYSQADMTSEFCTFGGRVVPFLDLFKDRST